MCVCVYARFTDVDVQFVIVAVDKINTRINFKILSLIVISFFYNIASHSDEYENDYFFKL